MSSKVEHNNEFSHTVTLGNKGVFDWSTQQERDTANGCRMLIMNATNFYNLLYLSEKPRQSKPAECQELLKNDTEILDAYLALHQPGRRIRFFR